MIQNLHDAKTNKPMILYCFPGNPTDFENMHRVYNEMAPKSPLMRDQASQSSVREESLRTDVSADCSPIKEESPAHKAPSNVLNTTIEVNETKG